MDSIEIKQMEEKEFKDIRSLIDNFYKVYKWKGGTVEIEPQYPKENGFLIGIYDQNLKLLKKKRKAISFKIAKKIAKQIIDDL